MKEKIIIIGGGGHAKVLISIIKKIKKYSIIGYTDTTNNGIILGIKYLGNDKILKKIIDTNPGCNAIVGIGQTTINNKRKLLFNKIKKMGFKIPTIISPQAIINENVNIGNGTVVFDGVIINSGSKISKNCILNTRSLIEHDCLIANNVFIGPNTILSGNVKINSNSFIGTNATIIQNISIPSNCLIGAGSVIINSIKKSGVYVGNPAKKIK